MTPLLIILALGLGQTHSAHGVVDFKNSCSPAVQPLLQQAVATLHSFGPEAEQTFRAVLREDPSCAIATWGIASILMTNPLAGVGPSPILAAAHRPRSPKAERSARKPSVNAPTSMRSPRITKTLRTVPITRGRRL